MSKAKKNDGKVKTFVAVGILVTGESGKNCHRECPRLDGDIGYAACDLHLDKKGQWTELAIGDDGAPLRCKACMDWEVEVER